jgi:hypothetical protein
MSRPTTKNLIDVDTYKYFSVILTHNNNSNMSGSNIKSGEITFSVEKSWLDTKNVNSDSVIVYRYHDDVWMPLDTIVLSSNSSHYIYKSFTPGYSYFSIGLKKEETGVENNAVTTGADVINVNDPNLDGVNGVDIGLDSIDGALNQATNNLTEEEIGKSEKGISAKVQHILLLVFIGMILCGGLVFVVVYRHKNNMHNESNKGTNKLYGSEQNNQSNNQSNGSTTVKSVETSNKANNNISQEMNVPTQTNIENIDFSLPKYREVMIYIDSNLRLGVTKEVLKERLIKVGWTKNEVEGMLSLF